MKVYKERQTTNQY